MSETTWTLLFIAGLAIAAPAAILGSFALERRFPGGLIKPHQRWMLFAALATIHLVLALAQAVEGAKLWRIVLSIFLVVLFSYMALDARRRSGIRA
jgi:hypothetical protein